MSSGRRSVVGFPTASISPASRSRARSESRRAWAPASTLRRVASTAAPGETARAEAGTGSFSAGGTDAGGKAGAASELMLKRILHRSGSIERNSRKALTRVTPARSSARPWRRPSSAPCGRASRSSSRCDSRSVSYAPSSRLRTPSSPAWCVSVVSVVPASLGLVHRARHVERERDPQRVVLRAASGRSQRAPPRRSNSRRTAESWGPRRVVGVTHRVYAGRSATGSRTSRRTATGDDDPERPRPTRER